MKTITLEEFEMVKNKNSLPTKYIIPIKSINSWDEKILGKKIEVYDVLIDTGYFKGRKLYVSTEKQTKLLNEFLNKSSKYVAYHFHHENCSTREDKLKRILNENIL